MTKLLGEQAPATDRQVPIVAVLGSGGGFRAMMCLGAAVKALQESGVLDCVTYLAGLSGSSWYMSHLYSQKSFPNTDHEDLMRQMKAAVTEGWKWKLTNSPSYVSQMLRKYSNGQPVSFTDFFGHILGDVLLKEQKNTLLSGQ